MYANSALAFVAAINAHDVDRLAALMTDDHAFIDALGNAVHGRDQMLQGWIAYFNIVPDYYIRVERGLSRGNQYVLIGRAGGTYAPGGSLKQENHWEIPWACEATVQGDEVAEWRIFCDNEPMRELMRRV